jgi:hypothetical protein
MYFNAISRTGQIVDSGTIPLRKAPAAKTSATPPAAK